VPSDHIKLYVGYDRRESIGFHTFVHSVIEHASVPVSITPIGAQLFKDFDCPKRADESTDFARIRFLIPWLEGYTGWAIFADGSDMLMRADIAELWALRNYYKSVMVVKHDYRTKHPRKFVGTPLECDNRDYPRKNVSSVMLINCSHFDWRGMDPDTVNKMTGEQLHGLRFARPDCIGELPKTWNWLCQEYGSNQNAKLVHYTIGIPAFPHYADTEMADEWAAAAANAMHVEAV
jgi:hypothetical protein